MNIWNWFKGLFSDPLPAKPPNIPYGLNPAPPQDTAHAPVRPEPVPPLVQLPLPPTLSERVGKYNFLTLDSGRLVAYIVPRGYRPSGKVIVHFHGLQVASWDKTPIGTIEHFGFLDILSLHAPDTVMIAPLGWPPKENKCSDLGFDPPHYDLDAAYGKSFEHTLRIVEDRLGVRLDSVTVSVHSAGGRVALSLVKNAPSSFQKLYLFDALYSASVYLYSEWLANNPVRKIYCASRPNKDIYKHSLGIHGKKFTNFLSETSDHYRVVTHYMPKFLDAK